MNNLLKELKTLSDIQIAEHAQRFFKTGKDEYGEGDKFLGIRVPILRKKAEQYKYLSLEEISHLLQSQFNEIRLISLFILIKSYEKSDHKHKEEIVNLYIGNIAFINNWNLVDASAPNILGDYLMNKKKTLLYLLASSNNLWERRIAIMSTFNFIKKGLYKDTIKIAAILINDREDLIHKAVGWMLREVGNRDFNIEVSFLNKYADKMPRTMLRYSIEKFPEGLRKEYLKL
ncbi:MAG: DNA alkylation repair protein [Actinobacteria bacterium]|nr:DNA alkylation repair protein [Actinomycetota bacterium]